MTIVIGSDGPREGVAELAECAWRLEKLASDLRRFQCGWLPSSDELEHAPLLDPYAVMTRPALRLVGGNHGHPLLKGAMIGTSELWVLAPELGWARTLSRFYRLGRPLGEKSRN
jgi:hypothetical protein